MFLLQSRFATHTFARLKILTCVLLLVGHLFDCFEMRSEHILVNFIQKTLLVGAGAGARLFCL